MIHYDIIPENTPSSWLDYFLINQRQSSKMFSAEFFLLIKIMSNQQDGSNKKQFRNDLILLIQNLETQADYYKDLLRKNQK